MVCTKYQPDFNVGINFGAAAASLLARSTGREKEANSATL